MNPLKVSLCFVVVMVMLFLSFLCGGKMAFNQDARSFAKEKQKTALEREVILTNWVFNNSFCVSRKTAKEIVEIAEKSKHSLFLLALISVESSFNPYAVSSKGAVGLGQIMPVHEGDLITQKLIENKRQLFDIETNILATEYIFLKMYKAKQFQLRKTLAAYLNEDNYQYYSNIMDKYFELMALINVTIPQKEGK